jgi:hypothetical protein
MDSCRLQQVGVKFESISLSIHRSSNLCAYMHSFKESYGSNTMEQERRHRDSFRLEKMGRLYRYASFWLSNDYQHEYVIRLTHPTFGRLIIKHIPTTRSNTRCYRSIVLKVARW